ncbi:MAG: transposase, partial [Planctomycetota bacterium]
MSETTLASKPSANLAIRLGLRLISNIGEISNHARKHAMTVVKCLTQAMGTHEVKCPCGEVMAEANSCRQRFCPLCSRPRLTRFLDAWRRRFLLVDHYHMVFTLPHTVNILWKLNRAKMGDILFLAVSITIKTLAADSQWLGAQPGFVSFLQTWSNILKFHPHLHVILTAGGVDAAGNWILMKRGKKFIIPHKVVSAMFKETFTRLLEEAMEKADFNKPSGWQRRDTQELLESLAEKAFVVWITGPYASPLGVLKYCAQYVCSGPVPNSKMVAVNKESVTYLMQPR